MGIPGSSLVFTTGIEEVDFTVTRVIDRVRIRSVLYNYVDDTLAVRLDKGFVDPEDLEEKWIQIVQPFPVEDLSADRAITIDGKSFTNPSGTHLTDWKEFTDAEELAETIEDATFAALESMAFFSGTETD